MSIGVSVLEGGRGFCMTRDGPKICRVTHE